MIVSDTGPVTMKTMQDEITAAVKAFDWVTVRRRAEAQPATEGRPEGVRRCGDVGQAPAAKPAVRRGHGRCGCRTVRRRRQPSRSWRGLRASAGGSGPDWPGPSHLRRDGRRSGRIRRTTAPRHEAASVAATRSCSYRRRSTIPPRRSICGVRWSVRRAVPRRSKALLAWHQRGRVAGPRVAGIPFRSGISDPAQLATDTAAQVSDERRGSAGPMGKATACEAHVARGELENAVRRAKDLVEETATDRVRPRRSAASTDVSVGRQTRVRPWHHAGAPAAPGTGQEDRR